MSTPSTSTPSISAGQALGVGVGVSAVAVVAWLLTWGGDVHGTVSTVLRLVHVLAAMIWVGMIVFVNFIQLPALGSADDSGRALLMKSIVPQVAASFRHTSHLTLLSGLLLLVPTGYLMGSLVFASGVEMPLSRAVPLWGGVAGGIIMWAIVHFGIWPRLQIVLGKTPGDAAAKAQARATIATLSRINLLLALPVTTLMVVAAHLA